MACLENEKEKMKNLFVQVMLRSLRILRKFVCPARMLFSQVALVPSSFQGFFQRKDSLVKCDGSWGILHAMFALTCLVAVFGVLFITGEGTSLAYRTPAPDSNIPYVDVASELSVQETSVSEYRKSHILVSSTVELIDELKQENLWDFEKIDAVNLPNVLVARFPADLGSASVADKKKAFIASLLPAAMLVLDEVRQERIQLMNVIGQLGDDPSEIIFSKLQPAWQDVLSKSDSEFIVGITKKYRTEHAVELLERVNVLPLSLIIAQGAIESSWGSSRFASQANNLFGMWTWGKKGLVPARREPGKTHRIALYDSIVDSVRAYVLTLNRVSAYDSLRQIRRGTLDSHSLSEGLLRYSERKELYVNDVKRVIDANNLKAFDEFILSSS